MNKTAFLLLILIWALAPTISFAHSEVVGEIVFENFKNELYATARLDKRFLTGALMAEGDCAPRDMMSVCGDQYVRENISLYVNGKPVTFEKELMEIQKGYVIITYKVISPDEKITNIKVDSSYMFKYNDHAILRISFSIDNINTSYNIKTSRRQIEAFFN